MTNIAHFILFSAILLFALAIPTASNSASPQVTINEIAWMGSKDSYQNEWIEFYNNTNDTVPLEKWTLQTSNGKTNIKLQGKISANEFYLLERTTNGSVPEIAADQIYTGALSNKGENLYLYDSNNNLIDSVVSDTNWPAGDNLTKQTMEKINPRLMGTISSNWQNSQNPNGTPKAQNSIFNKLLVDPPNITEKQETPAVAQNQTVKTPGYYKNVIINEILPSPEGPDEENEWIEILNKNLFAVDLAGWKISDTKGTMQSYTFPVGTKISPQGFLVFKRPETKIILNNDGDGLKLIQFDGRIVDEVSYAKAAGNQSYNRNNDVWNWSTVLTPGSENIISSQGKGNNKDATGVPMKEDLNQKELVAANALILQKQLGNPINSRFLSAYFIAMIVAAISALTILVLRKRLKNKIL